MLKYSQILLFLLSIFTESHARFLSETEMQSFIEAHKKEITNALPGANAHKGYRVIAVAHEMMQANFFDAPHKPKVAAYYSNVILSALKGIGVGGLSSKNKASFKEKSCALMALYVIGYSLKDRFAFDEMGTPQERAYFQKCNSTLKHGKDSNVLSANKDALNERKRILEGTLGGNSRLNFLNFKFGLEDGNAYYGTYRHIFEELAESIRRKADEEIFSGAKTRGAEDLRGPFSRLFSQTSPSSKNPNPSVPPATDQPKSVEREEEEAESWAGALYRDRAAAEKAIQRGNEEVCQNTGNLVVKFLGKSQYYSSTATLILQGSGNVVAITNAHCVDQEDGIVSSVELHMPDGEVIFFDEIYMNSEYSRITNDCDSALLKGKSAIKRILKPVLPMPIDSKMVGKNGYLVSCAKVNYLDRGRIVTLTDRATRMLSVLRIERTGLAPLYKAEIPRVVQTTKPTSALSGEKLSSVLGSKPIIFRPQSKESHQLESALSFGCSGSPFYFRVEGIDYIAGLFNSTIYRTEGGMPTRSSCIFSLFPQQAWMNQVLMGTVRPTYTLKSRF